VKVAVVYNHDSKQVINLFGQPNREKIGLKQIKRITDALREGGHQVTSFEGDKDLIDHLEEFMPRVLTGERPGMVLNVSYGVQGQSRYTHVPSILEMVGIPYVGSGPLAHSIALDKVVTKVMLVQNGLPTPGFVVLEDPDFEIPDLQYPLIVKPKHEAVSFGIRVVKNEAELREAAGAVFELFGQAVLVERFIDGREINVGILGNTPPEPLPPAELSFGETGPRVYSYEDKTGRSGREVRVVCPAPLSPELTEQAQQLALRAFATVGCADCARVDMRLDEGDNLYILEINSLPSLGLRGSYVRAAEAAGLSFTALVNRLVEVASARYFGTPKPPAIAEKPRSREEQVFTFLTERRDLLERRVAEWTRISSRTNDPIGVEAAARKVCATLEELGMRPVSDLTDTRSIHVFESAAGLDDGTLLVANVDVPLGAEMAGQAFRKEPEWLQGEGVGSSRASLVVLEYALRAARHVRLLRRRRLGVVIYRDEGRDARYSADRIVAAASRARRVLVLRPGGSGGQAFVQRRGQRKYRLEVTSEPRRPGGARKGPEVLVWLAERMGQIGALGSRRQRLSASFVDLKTETFPMLLPHRVEASLLVTYTDPEAAQRLETRIRDILGRGGPRWDLKQVSDRPPQEDRSANRRVADELEAIARRWEIPLEEDSSVWPSVAGLVPDPVGVVCGLGPVARDLGTPQEAVQRISLIQRTLLLAQFLLVADDETPGR
jgi:D-alanine-D-alanine ligase